MKKILFMLLLATTTFAHNITFLGCIDGKLRFKVTNGPSGGYISVKVVDGSNNAVACAKTAPFNKNTDGTSATFEVEQNATSCKSYTKVWVKWSKDNFVNTYRVEQSEYCKVVLPIKVFDFKGVFTNNNINLTWKTSDEKGFSHFEVQGMDNNQEITNFGSTINNFYSIESDKLNNASYFRLKQVDFDGYVDYTPWLHIAIKEEEKSSIYLQTVVGDLYIINRQKRLIHK